MKKKAWSVMLTLCVAAFVVSCGIPELEQATSREKVVATEAAASAQPESEVAETLDLKDYLNHYPEVVGGDLMATLSELLYGDAEFFSYDSDRMIVTTDDGAIRASTSALADGHTVSVLENVGNLAVYGVQIGMTAEEADAILLAHDLIKQTEEGEGERYYIEGGNSYSVAEKYITLGLSDDGDTVTRISYTHYYGRRTFVNY